ncbi:MAG: hypothetical protein HY252_11490 [Sphingobacteriales bacterium]|nr:hypothetical protein [Sphingobacteriales bacterium]
MARNEAICSIDNRHFTIVRADCFTKLRKVRNDGIKRTFLFLSGELRSSDLIYM